MTIQQKNVKRAFVLRIAPGGIDQMAEALKTDSLIIGWSDAKGLLDEKLTWEQFRQVVHNTYHSDEKNFTKSGRAAGNVWRFIREMTIGNYVVVPHRSNFYIAQVKDKAYYDELRVREDMAYRRPVIWLNEKKPFPRKITKASLQLRMKVQQACANADDLIGEIEDVLV